MITPAENYVKLQPEKAKRLRFDKWWWEERTITDPRSKVPKTVKVMVFHVTEEDGQPVDKIFSALAYKLQQSLAPLIETGVIFTRIVSVTWYPRDYATEYAVSLE
jgi:hypothetical protein